MSDFKVVGRYLDATGDEWWEVEGEGFLLAGRSRNGAMSGWDRDAVEARFGQLTEYAGE